MSDLIDIIRDTIPDCVVDGKVNVQVLSELIGTTRQNVWQNIVRDGRISANMARSLVNLPRSSLTADRILPYIR